MTGTIRLTDTVAILSTAVCQPADQVSLLICRFEFVDATNGHWDHRVLHLSITIGRGAGISQRSSGDARFLGLCQMEVIRILLPECHTPVSRRLSVLNYIPRVSIQT